MFPTAQEENTALQGNSEWQYLGLKAEDHEEDCLDSRVRDVNSARTTGDIRMAC